MTVSGDKMCCAVQLAPSVLMAYVFSQSQRSRISCSRSSRLRSFRPISVTGCLPVSVPSRLVNCINLVSYSNVRGYKQMASSYRGDENLLTMLDEQSSVPYHVQLADILRSKIKSGEIDYKLPSLNRLSQEYGISKNTVAHALRTLEAEGLIVTAQGRGTFVRR